jgi:hypothetical protein
MDELSPKMRAAKRRASAADAIAKASLDYERRVRDVIWASWRDVERRTQETQLSQALPETAKRHVRTRL